MPDRMATALVRRWRWPVCCAPGAMKLSPHADPVPRRLRFLVGDMAFATGAGFPAQEYAAVFVDCADHDRGGQLVKALFPAPFGAIDHHLSNGGFARHNFIDSGSSATAEILASMPLEDGLPVRRTDRPEPLCRHSYRHGAVPVNSTSRRTFLLAAELLARGARPSEAGFELYERETAGELRLLERFLSSLRFECGGRVCIGLLPDGVFRGDGQPARGHRGNGGLHARDLTAWKLAR